MGTAPIYPQPVNITSSESINRPKVSLRNDFFLPIPDHQLIEETMASIHDQLQCCLLFPRTNEKTPTTHTRSKTKTDEALSESTQKQRPTVSANPRLPLEDRRVRQAKLSSVQNTQIKSTFVVSLVLNVNTSMHQANSASNKLYTRCAELRTR